jgi:hypothetical protein
MIAENDTTHQFEPEEVNFIIKLREIVAKAFAQQGRLSEKDRIQLDKLKVEFQEATQKGADLLKKVGTAGLIVAFVAMTIFVGQFGFTNQGAAQTMKFASEQTSGVGGLFTNSLSGKQKIADGDAGLALNQLSAEQTKKQAEAGAKQEFSSVLQAALEEQKQASRAT